MFQPRASTPKATNGTLKREEIKPGITKKIFGIIIIIIIIIKFHMISNYL
jgi:hypothetical protein